MSEKVDIKLIALHTHKNIGWRCVHRKNNSISTAASQNFHTQATRNAHYFEEEGKHNNNNKSKIRLKKNKNKYK